MSAPALSPVPRSVTRRRKHAAAAKGFLARYAHYTTLSPTETTTEASIANARVTELLKAQAEIERALWLETSGRIGDEESTPRRIVKRVTVSTGEESSRV